MAQLQNDNYGDTYAWDELLPSLQSGNAAAAKVKYAKTQGTSGSSSRQGIASTSNLRHLNSKGCSSSTREPVTSFARQGESANRQLRKQVSLGDSPAMPEAGSMLSDGDQRSSSIVETSQMDVYSLKGTTFINNYVIVKTLAHGVHGVVKLAYDISTQRQCAIKVLTKDKYRKHQLFVLRSRGPQWSARGRQAQWDTRSDDLDREINILKTLAHDNVVQLYEVIDDPKNNKVLLVMEYIDGGMLMNRKDPPHLRRFSEETSRNYFCDLAEGLKYLHHHDVVHGDIKLENMLWSRTDSCVKLTDFGSARVVHPAEYLQHTAGTPHYMAPEQCTPDEHPYDGFKADVWALGVCLYEMVFGTTPYKAATTSELYDKIARDPVPFPKEPRVSAELRSLLKGLLNKDPRRRLKIDKVVDHQWVTKCKKLLPIRLAPSLGRRRSSVAPHCAPAKLHRRSTLNDREERVSELLKALEFEDLEVAKGSVIVEQGQPMQGIYYVERGLVARITLGQADRGDVDLKDTSSDSDDDLPHPPQPQPTTTSKPPANLGRRTLSSSRSSSFSAFLSGSDSKRGGRVREAAAHAVDGDKITVPDAPMPTKPRKPRHERDREKLQDMLDKRSPADRQLIQNAVHTARRSMAQYKQFERSRSRQNQDPRKREVVVYFSQGQMFGDLEGLTGTKSISRDTWQAATDVRLRVALYTNVSHVLTKSPSLKGKIGTVLAEAEAETELQRMMSKLASMNADVDKLMQTNRSGLSESAAQAAAAATDAAVDKQLISSGLEQGGFLG